MDVIIEPGGSLRGTLTVGPDKAIGHRALLCAAVAEGSTAIRPRLSGDDCRMTRQLIEQLGVRVSDTTDAVRVDGVGQRGLAAPREELFCGESGTTFRLAAGVLAGQPFQSRLTAGAGLSRRPMRRIVEPLERMGARIRGTNAPGGGDGAPQELYPPLTIEGTRPLRGIRYEMPVASAQVKSAILLAALGAREPSEVTERLPTRDHTERMLRAFGVRVACERDTVRLTPGPLRSPQDVRVPGDFSSAAFLIVAACVVPGSRVTVEQVGLNPTRTALLTVLDRMGARVGVERGDDGWEPSGRITASAGELQATRVEPEEVPGLIDELPVLMVAAARARGITRLSGIGELRVKETDRIRSMVDGLHRLGARVRLVDAETLEIEGTPLRGSVVEAQGDHRTAMSLAVAGLAAEGTTTVRGGECVSKSFPEFWNALRALTPASSVKTVDKP